MAADRLTSISPGEPRTTRLGRLLALSTLCLLLLPTCDPGPPREAVGVSLSEGGNIEIHYVLCPGERITGVWLVETEGGVIGDADDKTLWRIASSGSTDSKFEVGQLPDGFIQVAPLRQKPSHQQLLGVLVDTTRVENLSTFTVDKLKPGRIWIFDKNMSPETFADEAVERC